MSATITTTTCKYIDALRCVQRAVLLYTSATTTTPQRASTCDVPHTFPSPSGPLLPTDSIAQYSAEHNRGSGRSISASCNKNPQPETLGVTPHVAKCQGHARACAPTCMPEAEPCHVAPCRA